MDAHFIANTLPDPVDPTRPPYGVDEAAYPRYYFRFGDVGSQPLSFTLSIPTSDPNPAESGPISYPEQARWVRDLIAALGLEWREDSWPGYFFAEGVANGFGLVDGLLARGVRLLPPCTLEDLEAWRARL
jgi:hypothetical protein